MSSYHIARWPREYENWLSSRVQYFQIFFRQSGAIIHQAHIRSDIVCDNPSGPLRIHSRERNAAAFFDFVPIIGWRWEKASQVLKLYIYWTSSQKWRFVAPLAWAVVPAYSTTRVKFRAVHKTDVYIYVPGIGLRFHSGYPGLLYIEPKYSRWSLRCTIITALLAEYSCDEGIILLYHT